MRHHFELGSSQGPREYPASEGRSNLPRPSVINVSQIITVDKSILKEKIGTLSRQRVLEIVAGLHVVYEPRDLPQQPCQT